MRGSDMTPEEFNNRKLTVLGTLANINKMVVSADSTTDSRVEKNVEKLLVALRIELATLFHEAPENKWSESP